MAYLKLVPVFQDESLNQNGIPKKVLLNEGISESSLKTLVKNKIFESYQKLIPRFDLSGNKEDYELELSAIQSSTLAEILKQFESKQTVLFHGITGSGKTEIYIELIRKVMDQGSRHFTCFRKLH
jgi:primosomal protein N' (replication factor Y)